MLIMQCGCREIFQLLGRLSCTGIFLLLSPACFAQNVDTNTLQQQQIQRSASGNSHKMPGSTFWGNSTVFGIGFTQSSNNEFSMEAGRALVSESGLGMAERNIGVGYDHLFNAAGNNYYKIFYELSVFTPPIGGVSMRLEASANDLLNTYFIRPYIGLNFAPAPQLHFDIQYCHAFLIAGHTNPFKNGVTIRAEILLNPKKWEHAPSHRHH